MKKLTGTFILTAVTVAGVKGQSLQVQDSIQYSSTLNDITVKARSSKRSSIRVTNTEIIGRGELIRAACCNLGESFTTNPSVDVSYNDAATGARQIKLLGLNGIYVQMLTENMPNLRGASVPYSLGYVPGPWMQNIQVSKGAASVKNGYESITGQINVEYVKPQGVDGLRVNAYSDSDMKLEANVDGSKHLTDRLSSSVMLHFENRQKAHDSNGDGFMDMPKLRQYNGMWRMAYVSPVWVSQLSVKGLRDERESGLGHTNTLHAPEQHYGIQTKANRFELQWKNGFTLDPRHNTSLALMMNASIHDAVNIFGKNQYDVNQKNSYAQLMYETDLTPEHNVSVGLSMNHDSYRQTLDLYNPLIGDKEHLYGPPHETTTGLYAQYTYKWGDNLTVMPGIRWDYSTEYGGFWTPRLHIKYAPWEHLTLRASAGKGYRSPHALAENVSLLASGKTLVAIDKLQQEEAWNMGVSAMFTIPISDKNLEVNMDYYYTDFNNQMLVNPDGVQGTASFSFENLSGVSYTHAAQIDVTYPFLSGLTATGAFRYIDSRVTYDGELRRRPLTSHYKAMITVGYKTPLELWHFDLTGSMNGSGELYDGSRFHSYFQLQAQITREFRHFSIYVGGENLTNYTIKNPIREATDPWSAEFDATQVWGPVSGAMGYVGIRYKIEKL